MRTGIDPRIPTLCLLLISGCITAATAQVPSGGAAAAEASERIFQDRCMACHGDEPWYAPARSSLGERGPDAIVAALTGGAMQPMAAGLSREEIEALARHLATAPPPPVVSHPAQVFCEAGGAPFRIGASDWNGWARDLASSRFQPDPGIRAEEVPRLRVKWAFALDGEIHSQPTVVGGRVFVSSIPGQLYALDAATGCVHWSYQTAPGAGGDWGGAGARSTVVIGALPASLGADRYAAYLGDDRAQVHAVDVATGEPIWTTRIDPHPMARVTGSPVLLNDRLYVPVSSLEEASAANPLYSCCTFRGSLVALDAYTGTVLWKSHTIPDEPRPTRTNAANAQQYGPAGAPIWSTPTLDPERGVVYAATGNSYTDEPQTRANAVIAFDLETGEVRWSRQMREADNFVLSCPSGANCPEEVGPDFDFGSSPILRPLPGGGEVLVLGDKGGVVYAIDPDDRGRLVWEVRVGSGSALGGVQWGSAADDRLVYAAVSDAMGPAAVRRPGLTALDIATGEIAWHTPAPPAFCSWPEPQPCSRGYSAAISAIPGAVFSGSLDGHLRAYSTTDGSLLWFFDTARLYETVSGRPAAGGSIDGPGPTIAAGTLFLTSGYSRFGRQPGNVLLAFTVGGR
jgi:polyvinyl alcohol dehydrogenase (cytochrome)